MQQEVTRLLVEWREGNRAALDALLPVVYEELRRLAESYISRERSGHTLQPTALVHEAYVRLIGQDIPDFQNRAHFFGALPILLLLSCPLMHMFMHHGHKHGDHHGRGENSKSPDESQTPDKGSQP